MGKLTAPSASGRPLQFLCAALVCGFVLSGCAPGADEPAPTETEASSPDGIETVASELVTPWSVAFHGERALISESDTARIVEITDSSAREVGTIPGVAHGGEGGLLGIAVHDGHLYAYSTGDGGENRIQRYALTDTSGELELGDVELVLGGIPAAGNHNGGRIAFGPDGMLYATTGDARQPELAQDVESLAGKILRLTPEGAVPADNPFQSSAVYSLGHRNPQGIAWADDGTLYASEFGQNTWDELNVIEAGANYGWPVVEGIAGQDNFVDPVQQWKPADGSPSGIAIVDGSVFIANLRGERLREVPLSDLGDSSEHFVGEHGRLRDVTLAPDGSLWVLTHNTDGRGSPRSEDDRILHVPLDALAR